MGLRTIGACLAFLLAAACARPSPPPWAGRIVDLTHAFDATTLYWPTEEGFVLERGFEGITEGGYYYAAHRFRSAEHGGTHLDAPVHFAEGRDSVEEIPLERLMGEAVLVDVREACARDADHEIRTEALLAWEAEHGRIPEAAILLLRTGFGERWPHRLGYLGTDRRGAAAVAELHFPGLHPGAATWLARDRRIAAVGIDTASIDRGQSTDFRSHRVLFAQQIPAFENLANLEQLPATGFRVIALPMKIRGGSGAPLRAVALLP